MPDIVFSLIDQEKIRQSKGLELIPSENYVSADVLKAMGTVLTNKYSEGYPSFQDLENYDPADESNIVADLPNYRYYGGQTNIDKIERLAIARAMKLFHADHANVQPHSGANANEAVYFAWCKPGDKILAMNLGHGGHLTHGCPVTRSAKIYQFINYGVTPEGDLDYDEIERLAETERPKIILIGYSAFMKIPDFARIARIGQKIGALLMADMAQGGPLEHIIAAKAVAFKEALSDDFKNYSAKIVENAKALAAALQDRGFILQGNGTDNHLILVNVKKNFGIDGKFYERALDLVGLTLNANAVPEDTSAAFRPSGVRLGTPAITTRGMGILEMQQIADWMKQVMDICLSVKSEENLPAAESQLVEIRHQVETLATKFPVPGIN